MSVQGTDFLAGGGHMGARMRAFDWRSTPLGAPAQWPQSLKTVVRVMLDSRFAMWMQWGPEGTFFCNDAYLPTVGNKRDWVLGARVEDVWSEIWPDIAPRIEQVLTTGQATWDSALRLFLRRSGYDEETFHTFSYSPVHDEAGGVAGMLCVVQEDTERVIGARRLQLLRELAVCADTGAATLAATGRALLDALAVGRDDVPFAALYLAGDEAAAPVRLAGATAAPLAGRIEERADTAFGGAVVAAMACGGEQLVSELPRYCMLASPWAEPLQQALAIALPGAGGSRGAGALGCLVLAASPRQQLDDGYRSFLALVAGQFAKQLVDTQLRLQAEQRAASLAELDRAKNLFFSNVSHELRTPLTLISGPLQNLQARRDLPDAAREELELIHGNAERLRRLVNTLLDFSRIEAGRVRVNRRATDLAALTRDLAAVFRSAVEAAGLEFVVRCEPLPEPAWVDREMWEKVVLNLLSNALKFTFEGRIEVTLAAQAGAARLEVRDTGIGIAAHELPRVFERFHRVEGARGRTHEGSGIGLALVKELVRLHDGTVTVDSVPGRGSSFAVTMPLGRDPAAVEGEGEGEREREGEREGEGEGRVEDGGLRAAFLADAQRAQAGSHSAPAPAATADNADRAHILVVDDNADMRGYLQRLLGRWWRVSTAPDGAAALDTLRGGLPDLVITDMMMPRLDGRGLIQHIRTQPAWRTLPVIVLSAQAGDEARAAGLQQGADDYLVKPFVTAELLARVEVQLMRARMQRAEDALNRRLADIFRSAPVGVALLRGPEHRYEFVNAQYLQFVGGREVVGLTLREAMPELDGQGIYEMHDAAYASGNVFRGHSREVHLRQPGGGGALEQRWFEFVCQPLRDGAGAPVSGIAVVAVDVTGAMRARHLAEGANRAKDEFIAMLGHELRNPLAPITTALQLMKMREPQALLPERQIVERQVTHMARLVDDLLDVARIARGNLELRRVRTELAAVVDKAIETAGPLFETKRQRLAVELPMQGLPVLADVTRLTQVVANLLTNAAKFTPAEGRIAISAAREGADVVLAVSDSGVGMSVAELASVFELFVQGQQGMSRPQGGLGLGLAIARNLARLHGGSLAAASEGPGRGSRFTLRLPLAAEPAAEPGAAAAAGSAAPAPAGRRVLLVDDNADAAYALGELLRAVGHDVVLAEDGPSALRALDAGPPPAVALLDIGLPVMSGFELAQQVRQRHGSAIRLIALTGYGQAADIERGRSSGFDLHLVKPVPLDALLRAVAEETPP